MAHKRTIIRQYFETLLKAGVVNVSNRVYSGRINPKQDESYPYLTIFTKNETITERSTMSTSRELELHIGIVVKNNDIANGDFYEVIDDTMFEVEEVMSRQITVQSKNPLSDPYVLVNEVELVSSATDHNNESSSDIGGGLLVYRVEYEYSLPITPLTLEDFDVDGSIANLIITNPGVPANV